MRALLITNPFATSTTDAGRDALAQTLASRVDLTVELTTHRGHAGELAAAARVGGTDLVIVHGGDGTVNEAVNGLLDGPGQPETGRSTPTLAVVPGGSANVFARSLGIHPDPLQATGQLVNLITDGARRRVSLGHADGRWFLFNAGMGVDAEVVHAVERQRVSGKPASDARYVWTTIRQFIASAKRPATLTVAIPGQEPVTGVHFVFVSNSNPWTFIGERPVLTNPGTTFDSGLGVFASRSMAFLRNLPLAAQLLTNRTPTARHLFTDDDVESVRVVADEPIDMQMDGDFIGPRSDVAFAYCADRLEVVAPAPQA
ncbi:diacylglycerol kinase family protein [Williamsia sp. CHRR-6]|uniref:diacylglycerol/lipid kinase family protein n=1 Tax=Williamsia sp. CHRR-6 TaxID=2835871 RepID=UPI0027DC5085|nr:diacylglycerol kinase family protein [Williamsia sp. CHRR-6]